MPTIPIKKLRKGHKVRMIIEMGPGWTINEPCQVIKAKKDKVTLTTLKTISGPIYAYQSYTINRGTCSINFNPDYPDCNYPVRLHEHRNEKDFKRCIKRKQSIS
jgi:hypothetical protein